MPQMYKITLSTGKIIALREMTIKLKNQAIEAASLRTGASASSSAFQGILQDEILRVLLVSVDNRSPSGADKEDLDGLFSYAEYQQMQTTLQDVMGGAEGIKKPKIEMVTTSS